MWCVRIKRDLMCLSVVLTGLVLGGAVNRETYLLPLHDSTYKTIVRKEDVKKVSARQIPLTARSYVQDGLIAHFDGIENSGYGVHSNVICRSIGNTNRQGAVRVLTLRRNNK